MFTRLTTGVVAAAAALTFTTAGPASAATGSGTVTGTGTDGLAVRAEPTPASTNVGLVPEGSEVTIECQVEGPEVVNEEEGWTSTLWDYVPAQGGYVADAYLYTGHDGRIPGVPDCADDGGGDPGGPVAGIPSPCPDAAPFPADQDVATIIGELETRSGFDFQDGALAWDESVRGVVEVWWTTLEGMQCTPFVDAVNSKDADGSLAVVAEDLGSYWGDYGLTNPGKQSIDVSNQQASIDGGNTASVAQNIVHELAHAYSNDRTAPAYYQEYLALDPAANPISAYGASDTNADRNENFADVLGFYVARCAQETFNTGGEARPNPYDLGFDAYYAYARDTVFAGKEFGPAPGSPGC